MLLFFLNIFMLLSLGVLTRSQTTSLQDHFSWRCIADGKLVIQTSTANA